MKPDTAPREDSPLHASVAALAGLERRLSVPLIFGLLAFATFFIAWNRGIALMYALFAVLVGAALSSLLGPRLMLRPATLRLRLPRQAAVGDAIAVIVSVEPHGWPRKRQLLQIRSPYPFAPEQHLFLPTCGAGSVREQGVNCSRRGIFRLSEATVASAYPLGIATFVRRWPVADTAITVYPRVYPAGGFLLPAGSNRSSSDMEHTSPAPGHELFREVRAYRRGDNPRHIHWRSSARRGELIVKQFDAFAPSEIWIVPDLDPGGHAGRGEHHTFERALEITATIATLQIRAGRRCGVAAGLEEDGRPRLLLPPQSGQAHLQAIMEALAALRADCSAPYSSVLRALAPHYRAGQQWVLFQHGEQRIAPPAFQRNQRAPYWFRFDTAGFADFDAPRPQLLPPQRQADGMTIARDTDMALVFKS